MGKKRKEKKGGREYGNKKMECAGRGETTRPARREKRQRD